MKDKLYYTEYNRLRKIIIDRMKIYGTPSRYFADMKEPEIFKFKKQNAMRTDVELLKLLRENYVKFNEYWIRLCSVNHKLKDDNIISENENKRLKEMIKEMKPDLTHSKSYYWDIRDTSARVNAINKLINKKQGLLSCCINVTDAADAMAAAIQSIKNNEEKMKKYKLLKDFTSPAWEIKKGEILTKEKVKKYLNINNPEDYSDWFEEIKKEKEKTLDDYKAEFASKTPHHILSYLKQYHPKQYYTIILQMIADDLSTGLYSRNWKIEIKYGISLEVTLVPEGYETLGCVYFEQSDHADEAIKIMGDKIQNLF